MIDLNLALVLATTTTLILGLIALIEISREKSR